MSINESRPIPIRPQRPFGGPAEPVNGPTDPAGRAEAADRAVYVISVAAELAGVHPQTLRVYERRGLVDPSRTGGGNRRYSPRDIEQLRRIQELTAAGLNLEGVRRVLELEADVARLTAEIERIRAEAQDAVERTHRHYRRDLVPVRQSVVVSRLGAPNRRRR